MFKAASRSGRRAPAGAGRSFRLSAAHGAAPGWRRQVAQVGRALFLLLGLGATGCAVNPVTGQRDLMLVSEAQELQIGAQQYAPSQQSQGGSYDLDPELTRYVQSVGKKLAAVSDRQLPYEFVVLNNGVPNAWALPGGKIAVNRGLLLELQNEAELAAVLGHEIVHAAARHSAQQISRGQLAQVGMAAAVIGYGDRQGAELVAGGAQLASQLVMQRYGRDAERESDHYGMLYMKLAGYDPAAAVSLQQTFLRLSEGRDQDWLSGLFASHPPSAERVANNQAYLAELGAGGVVERERYQAAMARLRRTAPAYAAFDKGREALAAGKLDEAEKLARDAMRLEPREAFFPSLLGDVAQQRGDVRGAIAAYDQAIRLNDRFFLYPLRRGLARLKAGNRLGGQQDLEASVRLLPTAAAMNELGKLAIGSGNADAARGYFEGAAVVQGPVGDEARGHLARLDLGSDPSRVLRLRAFVDAGQLGAEIANPSPVAASDVVVEFLMRPDPNTEVQRTQRVVQRLAPGQRALVASGLFVGASPETQVRIVSARAAD